MLLWVTSSRMYKSSLSTEMKVSSTDFIKKIKICDLQTSTCFIHLLRLHNWVRIMVRFEVSIHFACASKRITTFPVFSLATNRMEIVRKHPQLIHSVNKNSRNCDVWIHSKRFLNYYSINDNFPNIAQNEELHICTKWSTNTTSPIILENMQILFITFCSKLN